MISYQASLGKHQNTLLNLMRNRKAQIPDKIKNRPTVNKNSEFYWTAFWHLETERNNGFDIGSIPWSKIKKYADYHGLDKNAADDLIYIIQKLDVEYLKIVRSKNKPEGSNG